MNVASTVTPSLRGSKSPKGPVAQGRVYFPDLGPLRCVALRIIPRASYPSGTCASDTLSSGPTMPPKPASPKWRFLLALAACALLLWAWSHTAAVRAGQAARSLSLPGQDDLTFWVQHDGLLDLHVEGEVGYGDLARLLMRRRSNAALIRKRRDRFTFPVQDLTTASNTRPVSRRRQRCRPHLGEPARNLRCRPESHLQPAVADREPHRGRESRSRPASGPVPASRRSRAPSRPPLWTRTRPLPTFWRYSKANPASEPARLSLRGRRPQARGGSSARRAAAGAPACPPRRRRRLALPPPASI